MYNPAADLAVGQALGDQRQVGDADHGQRDVEADVVQQGVRVPRRPVPARGLADQLDRRVRQPVRSLRQQA